MYDIDDYLYGELHDFHDKHGHSIATLGLYHNDGTFCYKYLYDKNM